MARVHQRLHFCNLSFDVRHHGRLGELAFIDRPPSPNVIIPPDGSNRQEFIVRLGSVSEIHEPLV